MVIHRMMLAAGAGLLLASAGCSTASRLGELEGRVTAHDRPVTSGDIVFYDRSQGTAVSATLQDNGVFRAALPVRIGRYVVYWQRDWGPVGGPTPPLPKDAPARDIDELTSKVQLEIKEGKNQLDVVLE